MFECRPAEKALNYLKIQSGETALEVDFGAGYCLQRIATSVGNCGKVSGIDISQSMAQRARERLNKASLMGRVELCTGDAAKLPFDNETFDVAFISLTLELFESPEISEVLGELRRVLKPRGRLGVVSLLKPAADSLPVRVYEWIHAKWTKYVDCRPIYLDRSVQAAASK